MILQSPASECCTSRHSPCAATKLRHGLHPPTFSDSQIMSVHLHNYRAFHYHVKKAKSPWKATVSWFANFYQQDTLEICRSNAVLGTSCSNRTAAARARHGSHMQSQWRLLLRLWYSGWLQLGVDFYWFSNHCWTWWISLLYVHVQLGSRNIANPFYSR